MSQFVYAKRLCINSNMISYLCFKTKFFEIPGIYIRAYIMLTIVLLDTYLVLV